MNKSNQVLAFDFGASSGRAMLGRLENGQIKLEEIHRFSNDPVPVGKTLYWDALRLFHEIRQGLVKAKAYGKIDSIGIDTWGVDFGLVDSSGRLLENPVHYRDTRTAGMLDKVSQVIPWQELYGRTGIQYQRFNTIFQLAAIQRENPALLDRADKLILMPDLFTYWLTGRMQSEKTMASTGQLLNPWTGQWDTELLERLGIPTRLLCPLVDPGSQAGTLSQTLCDELGLDPIPVVSVAAHDTASAVAAVPAEESDFIYISSGTWSLMGIERSSPLISDEIEKMNFTNERGYDNTIRFLKNIMGLWLIQESRRQWIREGDQPSFGDLEQEAMREKPFAFLIDPDDPRLGTPGDLPSRIREICQETGQGTPQRRGEIVRCIYESLALKYRTTRDQIEQISGHAYPAIHVVGGGTKDTLLSQFTANATGRRVLTGPAEGTAMGNVAVQLIANGAIRSLTEARKIIADSTEIKVYEPEQTDRWNEAFARFESLFQSMN